MRVNAVTVDDRTFLSPVRLSEPYPPVLAAQVRPPTPSFHVIERSALMGRLSRAVEESPLTLINAPAGYGKTVLTASWAARRDRRFPVAWLTVTDRDQHAGTFLSHLWCSLACAGAVVARATQTIFPGSDDVDELSERLLTLAAPVTLVVDGADRVDNETVFGQLARLVQSAGDRLRLVLITRAEPLIPLHRHRLEGTLAEIGSHELAFTPFEVRAVLAAHGLPASQRMAEQVLRRTEGWPAGVRMAALSLSDGGDGDPLDAGGADYLRAEVIKPMTDPDLEFLTTVGVVERIDRDLAGRLSGRADADEILTRMTRGNMFLQKVEGEPGRYRIHPLLRDLLNRPLQSFSPRRIEDLHRCASDWFEATHQPAPAVQHAAAAGDLERAAALAIGPDAVADLLQRTPMGARMADDLSALPDLEVPDILVARAALAAAHDEHDLARVALRRWSVIDGSGDQRRRVTAAVVAARLHDGAGDATATLRALRTARENLTTTASPLLRILLDTFEGTALLRAGNIEAACKVLGDVCRLGVGPTRPVNGPRDSLRHRCLAALALAEVCRGHLTRGQALAQAAERLAADADVTARWATAAQLAQAWVALERQDVTRASGVLGRAARRPETAEDDLLRSILLLVRVRLMRDQADKAPAATLLAQAKPPYDWLRGSLDRERVALGLLGSDRIAAPGGGIDASCLARIEELLERAMLCHRLGNVDAARTYLARTLTLAADERFRRPFAHLSPELRAMIRSDQELLGRASWLCLDQTAAIPAPSTPPRVGALTQRELEVLRHPSELHTTVEIAAEMFISVNTVRTHVRHVLEKFGVSRRNEAVRRARELELV